MSALVTPTVFCSCPVSLCLSCRFSSCLKLSLTVVPLGHHHQVGLQNVPALGRAFVLVALLHKAFLPSWAGREEPGQEQTRNILWLRRTAPSTSATVQPSQQEALLSTQLIEILVNRVADEVSHCLSPAENPSSIVPTLPSRFQEVSVTGRGSQPSSPTQVTDLIASSVVQGRADVSPAAMGLVPSTSEGPPPVPEFCRRKKVTLKEIQSLVSLLSYMAGSSPVCVGLLT